MNNHQQVLLLEELLGLKEKDELFLDEKTESNPVQDYLSADRFEQEQRRVFKTLPNMVAHSSELDGPNSFLRRSVNGQPLLIVRGDDGQARIFINVCRHRGTRLVNDETGCKKRFSCPYHAWTWNSSGEFVGAPHFEAGFPDLDTKELGLKALPCAERYGFIWLLPVGSETDVDEYLAGLGQELAWVDTENLAVYATDEQEWQANWKLLVEGGLEAYHFRVAHRKTIAPLFNDNLSSYQTFGPHIRSVLPRASITELKEQPQGDWDIRQHSNVPYNIFPSSFLLVQSDHVVWIRNEPISADRTRIRVATLAPNDSTQSENYWQKNHEFSVKTLTEDFELAESIQSGLDSGANEILRFGRFEGALNRFNEAVNSYL